MTESQTLDFKSGYTTARTIIKILRPELLAAPEGAFIGSVNDLMTRFGISRSTMRQAVRVLEHEQLLISKRGVSGGFFVGRPRIDSIVSSTATYLHSRHVGIRDFIAVARTLNTEMARLAAQSTNQVLRDRLTKLLSDKWQNDFATQLDLVRADRDLEGVLAQMAASPVIELLLRVVYDLGIRTLSAAQGPNSASRRKLWQSQRLALCEAVLDGDANAAVKIASRHYDIVSEWL
jgi:GntR family transcriptional regulator, transcriptional repressor for pyruvate dehydrogenase complex